MTRGRCRLHPARSRTEVDDGDRRSRVARVELQIAVLHRVRNAFGEPWLSGSVHIVEPLMEHVVFQVGNSGGMGRVVGQNEMRFGVFE